MKSNLIALTLFSAIALTGCGAAKKAVEPKNKPLYEVLTSQESGGGNIRFYEILTEEKEIRMLQGDEHLQGKIKADDLKNASFVILNMGEKSTGGYRIEVGSIEETADKIVITVKDKKPDGEFVTQALTYPYTVIKINSKKPIEIK